MKTEPLPAATLSNLHQPSELEDPGRAGIGRANAAGAQLAQKIEGRLANSVVFYGELAQAAGPAPPQNTLRAKPADEVPMSAAQQGVQLRETMPPTPEHGADGRPGRLREAMHWARTLFRLIAANAHGWAEVDVDEGTRFRGARVAAQAALLTLRGVAGAAFDATMLMVSQLVGVGRDARGVRLSRGLNENERSALQSVYGDQLNLDVIQVEVSPAMTMGMRAGGRVVGNTIYLTPNLVDEDGTVVSHAFDTFLHEAAHVYQFQTGGADYMHNAVFAHIYEDSHEVYDWLEPLQSGEPFSQLNPEQQAELITVISLHRQAYPDRPVGGLFRSGEHVAPDLGAMGLTLDGAMAGRLNTLAAELLQGTPLRDVRW